MPLTLTDVRKLCRTVGISLRRSPPLTAEEMLAAFDSFVDLNRARLNSLPLASLKAICKRCGITGYSNKPRSSLIAMIDDATGATRSTVAGTDQQQPQRIIAAGLDTGDAQQATPSIPPCTVRRYRKTKICKRVKCHVWEQYIGNNIPLHRCLCCKKTVIHMLDFEVGHVVSEFSGGSNAIENLRPICSACNKAMGISSMLDFVHKYHYYIG